MKHRILFFTALLSAHMPLLHAAVSHAPRAQDMASLRAGFARPPREAGPWVYWFVFDNVLSKEEITREVEELAAAGIAGAELRFITFHGWSGVKPSGMDADTLRRTGQRKFEYLSDEFVDLLAHLCAEARRTGLLLAINMGMGWPPGGTWITNRHRSRHLTWQDREIAGPAVVEEKDLSPESMVLAWRLDPGTPKAVVPGSCQPLTGNIRDGTLRWVVPDGRWLVVFFRTTPGDICDKGSGPEADPGSREAILFHLNQIFSRFDPKLKNYYGSTLIDVASDSWEYGRGPKRYWSPAILEAFPGEAGYDLREKMHTLLGYGPDQEMVIADLMRVEKQLVRRNFFETATKFLHERGLGHRPQAYGRGLERDLLEVYSAADTPEIEQGMILPEAVWSAHTAGKPLISAEAFTFLSGKTEPVQWPHGGPWETTPALLRWHANRFYAEGINRIQMHAFSYSPPGVPLPGWRIYAETHLNRNVPWWPYLPSVTSWMARNQWVLQAGSPVADALVYPVRSDPPDGPYHRMGEHQPISAANAVDAANRFTFLNMKAESRKVPYAIKNICLLEDIRTVEEAERILTLLDRGARLICCDRLPGRWSALQTPAGARLSARFESAGARGQVIDARTAGWEKALDDVRSVRWTPAAARLVFQHRRVEDGDIYLIVNQGDAFQGEVSFPHAGGAVEQWDADTGSVRPASSYREKDGRICLPLRLDHFASSLVSFSAGKTSPHKAVSASGRPAYETGRTADAVLPVPLLLAGPWRLVVDGRHAVSPQEPFDRVLERLVSWRQLTELKFYAGTATYMTEFELAPEMVSAGTGWQLDLGQVYELAEIRLNGRKAGTCWYPPFTLDITGLIRAGGNALWIDVPNVLQNHMRKDEQYIRPSGLLGPVSVRPYAPIALEATSSAVTTNTPLVEQQALP